jgi:U3 small nucleolar RNA-associated protein 12
VVVGTKSGELTLYDIITSTQLSTYKAHSGAIWSIGLKPDGRGLVSGSADKDVKFWEFEMKEVVSEGDKVVDRLGRETIVSWTLLLCSSVSFTLGQRE